VQPETQFVPGTTPFIHGAIDHNLSAKTNALGLSAYWQPLQSGWWPSVSVGWGINSTNYSVPQPAGSLTGGVTPNDGNYVWEWWYKFQVTDKISVTPALIYLSRPLGQQTPAGESFSQFGGLVKTSFRF
jgi:carbohydrate-selective porin OprB